MNAEYNEEIKQNCDFADKTFLKERSKTNK